MASKPEETEITNKIVRLAGSISPSNMEIIALGYLDLEEEPIASLRDQHKDSNAFNRAVLRKWINMNSNRLKSKTMAVLASKLYQAADDEGYVNPTKIQKILGMTQEEAAEAARPDPSAMCTEKELLQMVEKLREHVSTEIKPEIASWAKEYTPRIEDIQTTVTIMKTGNGKNSIHTVVQGYEGIFEENTENISDKMLLQSFAIKGSVSPRKGERIIMKGEEGVGKSILCKQIVWDWAKKKFSRFSIVFYVNLKVMNPGDVIEDVIIDQNGELGVTSEKLQLILERVGHQCLIILDGFDEKMINDDSDLMKILKSQRLSQCSVLLALDAGTELASGSRFETECEVQGFGHSAQNSMSKIVQGLSDLEAIMKWKPSVPMSGTNSKQANPLLAMFLCVLVNNKVVDLENNQVTLNEVLYKLTKWFCRKYTSCDLKAVVESVGRLAFESLQFGRKLSKEDVDVASLDRGILSNGLLICHKSLVIFPQKILQLHLAVLYFVQMFNDGKEIETLFGRNCEDPVCINNTLFLHFSLELLSDQKYLTLENRDRVYHKLKTFILKRMNFVQLDLKDFSVVHPSLLPLAFRNKDENALRFLKELLSMCTETKILHLSPDFPAGEILSAMKPVLENLTSICMGDLFDPIFIDVLKEANPDEFNVFIQSECGFYELLDCLKDSDRQYSLHYTGNKDSKPVIDLGKISTPNVQKLFIHQVNKYCMVVGNDMEQCSHLTHLSIFGKLSDPEHTMKILSEANGKEKFPMLSHLRFAMTGVARNQVIGKLRSLFRHPWKTLTHLDLGRTILVRDDFLCLSSLQCSAPDGDTNSNADGTNMLPELTSLVLRAPDKYFYKGELSDFDSGPWYYVDKLYISESSDFFPQSHRICNLTDLALSNDCREAFNVDKFLELRDNTLYKETDRPITENPLNTLKISSEQNTGTSWNLAKFEVVAKLESLDVSNCPYRFSLCKLLFRKFSVLRSLILSNCYLESPDLRSLAQASAEGWLPELQHMDISGNKSLGNLRDLFAFDSKWQTLKSLRSEINVDADRDNDLQFESLAEKVASGGLSNLKNLSFSTQKPDYLSKYNEACWKQLECLEIHTESQLSCADALAPIVEQIDKERQSCHSGSEMFPELDAVAVCIQQRCSGDAPVEKQILRKNGIKVFVVCRCYEEMIHFW